CLARVAAASSRARPTLAPEAPPRAIGAMCRGLRAGKPARIVAPRPLEVDVSPTMPRNPGRVAGVDDGHVDVPGDEQRHEAGGQAVEAAKRTGEELADPRDVERPQAEDDQARVDLLPGVEASRRGCGRAV